MKNARIIELEEKYWRAETSLEEERELKALLKGEGANEPLGMLFSYYDNERKLSTEKQLSIPKKDNNVRFLYVISSIAASLVLLFSVLSVFSPAKSYEPNHLVITDQQQAYDVTLAALSVLNGEISKGEQQMLQSLGQIDRTMIFQ